MKQIAALLGVSVSSVSIWTRDIEITAEQRQRNIKRGRPAAVEKWIAKHRLRRSASQREGRERARLNDPLHLAGCMLYWAEGAKGRNTVNFANSDMPMVKLFCRFLRECLGVTNDRITLRLNVYMGNGRSIREIEDHWLRQLELPRSALRGHTLNHLPTSSSGKKKNRLPYGVAQIRVLKSTHLMQHILGAIQEYGGFDAPRWLDGPPAKEKAVPRRDLSAARRR